ncbi:MAG: hypothetical protein FJ399_20015 [Verrucomicrobia bacterium]|nr:hypothetical protein [Verrucomicrobiota bacterium]
MRTDVEQLVRELPEAGIARATRLGLVLNPGLETETWRGLVTHVARLVRTSTGARQTLTAWLGDVLAYGETGGRGLITECAAATGINPGTLRNAKMICLRIPVSCRRDTLSWTHHCEVGIAFADPKEIERWLTIAESEGLSAMVLRRRIRARAASLREQRGTSPDAASITAFQLMRELRADDRMLDRHRAAWREWSPGAAQLALQELRAVTDFVDAMRARALEPTSPRPHDIEAN